jgi:hypothetical protein
MHRSSESFAALAAALAKAQAHLVNPEKSLTANIQTGRPGETARSFRYAPLSRGLEIVRKTLSEHEIAIIQTTAIDPASRMLNLTTLLAHSSGEWIASYWPVCSIAETAHPHRMGAALTYARRYALFTLVGIAGEDDLDAPDICMPSTAAAPPVIPPLVAPTTVNGRTRDAAKTVHEALLSPDQSGPLCKRLLTQIAELTSQDAATAWAQKALAAKNKLQTADAKLVEEAFEAKLTEVSATQANQRQTAGSSSGLESGSENLASSNAPHPAPSGIDKSTLALSEPRRYRNKEHLRFVTQQPCLLCGRKPSDAHHLRFTQPRALARKSSDEFAVPLCRIHHRAAHRAGDERAWWKASGIDPVKIARKLWKDTRSPKLEDKSTVVGQAPPTIAVSNDGSNATDHNQAQ